MLSCPSSDCQWKGSSIDQFFRHVQRMHDPLHGYMCIQNCGRLFTSITSLRKHVLSCKEINAPKENGIKRTMNDNELYQSNNQSEILVQKRSSSRENYENEIGNGNQLIRTTDNLKFTTADANRLSLRMTLKWLSENGLARKVAFDINKDVKQNIIKPLSSVIHDLQMTGAMTDECREVLDTMLESYNCTSEYKCIQQLKKEGFYEDPTFFTHNDELMSSSTDPFFETVIYLNT